MNYFDPLYGFVNIGNNFEPLVQSYWFRRLRHLRQLGLCYLSFPNGNHTRLEHSIGAYYLARRACEGFISGSKEQLLRISALTTSAALCHDLGHGPFSHMTENVLCALGSQIHHEHVSAAIIKFKLGREIENATNGQASADDIANVILAKMNSNPLVRISQAIVSSEYDVDRYDYLHRDSYYTSGDCRIYSDVASAWQRSLKLIWSDGLPKLVLTATGQYHAERLLILRKQHYARVVFDPKHMCLTGLFEKAIYKLAEGTGALADNIKALITQKAIRNERELDNALLVYGLVDYELLNSLGSHSEDTGYLTSRIRQGLAYPLCASYNWRHLHPALKEALCYYYAPENLFTLKRKIEKAVAEECKLSENSIVVVINPFKSPRIPLCVTESGDDLEMSTGIGSYLRDAYRRQYAISIFLEDKGGENGRDAERYLNHCLCQGGFFNLED